MGVVTTCRSLSPRGRLSGNALGGRSEGLRLSAALPSRAPLARPLKRRRDSGCFPLLVLALLVGGRLSAGQSELGLPRRGSSTAGQPC
jgi:hypothetical protein